MIRRMKHFPVLKLFVTLLAPIRSASAGYPDRSRSVTRPSTPGTTLDHGEHRCGGGIVVRARRLDDPHHRRHRDLGVPRLRSTAARDHSHRAARELALHPDAPTYTSSTIRWSQRSRGHQHRGGAAAMPKQAGPVAMRPVSSTRVDRRRRARLPSAECLRSRDRRDLVAMPPVTERSPDDWKPALRARSTSRADLRVAPGDDGRWSRRTGIRTLSLGPMGRTFR